MAGMTNTTDATNKKETKMEWLLILSPFIAGIASTIPFAIKNHIETRKFEKKLKRIDKQYWLKQGEKHNK